MAFRITSLQREKLFEFIKENPKLLSGRLDEERAQLWLKLSATMNSVPGGAQKNLQRWKKSVQCLKSSIKYRKLKQFSYDDFPIVATSDPDVTVDTAIRNLTRQCSASSAQQPNNKERNKPQEVLEVADSDDENMSVDSSEADACSNAGFDQDTDSSDSEDNDRRKRNGFHFRLANGNKMQYVKVRRLKMREKYLRRKLEVLEEEVKTEEQLTSCLNDFTKTLLMNIHRFVRGRERDPEKMP